jgi:hypothetical protein
MVGEQLQSKNKMKNLIIIWLLLLSILLGISLNSCNNETQAIERADNFIRLCSTEIIKNSETHEYSYDVRGHFYHNGLDINNYRVFVVSDSLRLICYSDTCSIEGSTLKIAKSNIYISKNEYPRIYKRFNDFKNQMEDCNITSYWYNKEDSYIQIYLGVEYFLIYDSDFGDRNYINSGDKLIKEYKNNWYLFKSNRPFDLG